MSSSSRKYMSKRQRPCDFCRSRKTACRIEGSLPCRLCTLHKRQCTFLEAAPPRKQTSTSVIDASADTVRPLGIHGGSRSNDIATSQEVFSPGSTVSPDSNRDAAFSPGEARPWQQIHSVNGSDPNVSLDFTTQFFPGFDETTSGTGMTPNIHMDNLSPNDFLARLDIQGSSNWLDSQLIEIQLDSNGGLNPQTLGYSGDMDPYLLQSYRYDLFGAYKFKQLTIHSVCQGNTPSQFLLSQPDLFSSSRQEMGSDKISAQRLKEKLEDVVSPDTGQRLIAMFRQFILPQYPIFSESLFPDVETSPPHLLAAIYMVAQPFAKFDDVLSIELAYEALKTQTLFEIVHEAIRYEAHDPDISMAQTLLLLVICPSTNPLVLQSSLPWSFHGTLISTAQNIGLHLDPQSWNIARWQIALRRRLAFTIFSLDKWLSASLGRSPLLTQDNWLVTSISTADGYDSFLTSELWSSHLRYSRLGEIMGHVLAKLFSLRAMHDQNLDIERMVSVAEKLLADLTAWHDEFLTRSREHPEEDAPLSMVSSLGYHYIKMTIHRAIVRPFLFHHDQSTTAAEIANLDHDKRTEIRSFGRAGIHTATQGAANFVKSLHQDHAQMLWPHWSQVTFSSICFLQLTMAISSVDTQEALTWFQDLHSTRKEMRLKSSMLPALRLGLLRIDAIFWKGIDSVIHLQPHVEEALKMSLELLKANSRTK